MMQKISVFILLSCILVSLRCYGQAERDTLFYELQPKKVDQARVVKTERKEFEYLILIRLKESYHVHFKKITSNNIGNYLALTNDDKIIASKLPTIQAKIPNGHLQIGSYKKKGKAKKVKKRILSNTK